MPNPLLSLNEREAARSWGGGGIKFEVLPRSVSTVPFIWNYMGAEVNHELIAGTVGISVAADGTVAPVLGWAIRNA